MSATMPMLHSHAKVDGHGMHTDVSYGRNYLFGEYATSKLSWSPIGFQGFVCSGHQHQGRSMQFTLWDDLICYMIEKIEGTVLHGK